MKKILLIIVYLVLTDLSGQDHLNPCLKSQSFHVVVIGSSTAAGAGPSISDSAWVNRYTKYLKSFNPNNSVTNLAVGGTTTYHIMPNGFIPPSGRPSPNTNNITVALSFGADAVVVNMPSNDAANNYGLNEQMSNFIAIAAVGESVGVPVYVCTTQPKNFSNSSQIQLQIDVRDSILSYFGAKAIDFWTTIATSSNTIDSLYDSGDGTHLNDAAHGILVERVKAKNILSRLADTLPFVDLDIVGFEMTDFDQCGNDSTSVLVAIANNGISTTNTIYINHEIGRNDSLLVQILQDSILGGLNSCSIDTLRFSFVSSNNGLSNVNFTLRSYIQNSTDSLKFNDSTDYMNFSIEPEPSISKTVVNDSNTVCLFDTINIRTVPNLNDSIVWFNNAFDTIPFAIGKEIQRTTIKYKDSIYVQAVRGPLHFAESLSTNASPTVDWNGIMFDIVAQKDLTVDSLSCAIRDLNDQAVEAYYRLGSYNNFTGNSSAWTYWGKDSIFNQNSGDVHTLNYSSLNLQAGDTLAIYLHMENLTTRLYYENNGAQLNIKDSIIQVISGVGVTPTFGVTYFPRVFSGEVFYHHGFKADGYCISERKKVLIDASNSQLNLGPDGHYIPGTNLKLDAGLGFSSYSWGSDSISFFANTSQIDLININSSLFYNGPDTVKFWVEGSHATGCNGYDTISLRIDKYSSLEEAGAAFSIYPNPSNGKLRFFTMKKGQVEIYNLSGGLVKSFSIEAQDDQEKDLKLSKGSYVLKFNNEDENLSQLLVIQ